MSNLLNYVCKVKVYFSYDTIKRRKLYPESYFTNYDFTKLVKKKKLEYENSLPETDSMSFSDLDHHINYSQHSEFQTSTNPRESVSYY